MQDLKSNSHVDTSEPEIAEPAAAALLHWLPVDAVLAGHRPCIKWIEWPNAPFAEPFISQTVERAKEARPGSPELITGVEALIQLEKLCDSVRPSGFIFHASRCGSTLLANVCRALDGAIVISEAAVVEKIVSRFFSYADGSTQSLFNAVLLRAALAVLGQRRTGTEEKLFVKFSALSTLQFRWVKRIWPDVPCVFMFRDPVEVIASNVSNPPDWMQFESIPEQAAAVTGLEPGVAMKLDAEERCARALGRFYAAGADLAATGALLIDYHELSIEKLIRVIEFFGLTPNVHEKERISNVAQLYSKDSNFARKFEPDSSKKQVNATLRARQAAELWAMDSYLRLRTTMTSHG